MEGGARPSSDGEPGEARSGPVFVRALKEEMRAIVEEVPRKRPCPCSSRASCPNCSAISGSSRLILSLSTEAAEEAAGDLAETDGALADSSGVRVIDGPEGPSSRLRFSAFI